MTSPLTPAEIETLRKGIQPNATPDNRRAACDLIDRLSPPEPEQPDEATKIWREMEARGCEAVGGIGSAQVFREGGYDNRMDRAAEISYLRQALSELIVSKDAEIARLKNLCGRGLWEAEESELAWKHRAEKAEAELTALRAENERLKIDNAVLVQSQKPYQVTIGEMFCKAAERNPAEPVFTDTPSILAERALGQIPAPDTAPVVEVTQADRDASYSLAKYLTGSRGFEPVASVMAHHRTEAEARGRRAALEKTDAEWDMIAREIYNAYKYDSAIHARRELKRLMTEGK